MNVRTIAALLTTAALAACAGQSPQASGSFQTRASPNRLFNSALEATTAMGYHVTSASRSCPNGDCRDGDSTISAEQGAILGRGSSIGMTVFITSGPGGTQTLRVAFVAPPSTFALGDFNENVTDYIAAVRRDIPDIHAAR